MPPEAPIRVLVVGATSAIATETARLANDRVEIVQQGERPVPADGEVHGQGRAFPGEGEHAGRARRAETLEHTQRGRLARACDALEDRPDRPGGWGARDDALILHEALRPVQPGPVAHAVEREEERCVGDDALPSAGTVSRAAPSGEGAGPSSGAWSPRM
jgi:hypothetical protein